MRNLGLDLLRAIAVLLVIGRHMHIPENTDSWLIAFTTIWHRGGWVGVDLFFVLSGYLISGLLFAEYNKQGSINIKRFLIRRGFKIYPAFWFFLLSTVLLKILLDQHVSVKGFIGEMLFIQNYYGNIWSHTWSLAVEEHFYFGIALLFWYLTRYKKINDFGVIPAVFIFVAIFCLLFRLATALYIPYYSYSALLFPSHLRIDSLMFGVFLSYLVRYQQLETRMSKIPVSLLITSGLCLLLPAFLIELNNWVNVFGVISFYLGAGLLLMACIRFKSSDNNLLNLFGLLGATSYSIYLWHMPVSELSIYLLKPFVEDSYLLYIVIYMTAAFVTGFILNKCIEGPSLRLRDKIFPSLANKYVQEK